MSAFGRGFGRVVASVRVGRHRSAWWLSWITAAGVCMPVALTAQADETLGYQGYLTDSRGAPVDGTVNVRFALYRGQSDTTPRWQDTLPVAVDLGVFSVRLGSSRNPFPPGLFDGELWLGIRVAGEADELAPRQPVSRVPYAYSASDAQRLGGRSASEYVGVDGGDITGNLIVSGLVSADILQATDRGVYFPDGTLQTTAAATGPSIPASMCPARTWVVGFDAAAEPVCGGGLRPKVTVVDDGTDTVGPPCCAAGDFSVSSDGLPAQVHLIGPNFGFKSIVYTACLTPSCDAFERVKPVSSFDWAAGNPAVAFDAASLVSIAYFDGGVDLTLIRCQNFQCSARSTELVLPIGAINADARVDLAIGADGLPLFSVFAISGFRVVHCPDAACTGAPTVTEIAATGRVGLGSRIAIPADGLPVVSYHDDSANALMVLKCGNTACSAGNEIHTVDDSVDAGKWSDIAIGADGLPVIAYFEDSGNLYRFARCADAACASATITNLPLQGRSTGGDYVAVETGPDGLPVIALLERSGAEQIRVIHCTDANCTGFDGPHVVAPVADVTGIGFGPGGLPVIGLTDTIVQCGRYDCANP